MIDGLYHDRDTWVHRIPAGAKLAVLALTGTAVFLMSDLSAIAAVGGSVGLVFAATRVPPRMIWQQTRFVLPMLLIIFLAQVWLADVMIAALVVLRFAVVVLAAVLLTLTTRTQAMLDALTAILTPLQPLGVDARKVGFTVSMTIRFIPMVLRITRDVREAQRARGLERSFVAVAMPVIIRLLKSADDISDAVEARGF